MCHSFFVFVYFLGVCLPVTVTVCGVGPKYEPVDALEWRASARPAWRRVVFSPGDR